MTLTGLAVVLKALADPVRLRLVSMIAAHEDGEACVCDLTEPLGLTRPTVRHHLKVRMDAGFLARSKRGTWAYYALIPARSTRSPRHSRPSEQEQQQQHDHHPTRASRRSNDARRALVEAGLSIAGLDTIETGVLGERDGRAIGVAAIEHHVDAEGDAYLLRSLAVREAAGGVRASARPSPVPRCSTSTHAAARSPC